MEYTHYTNASLSKLKGRNLWRGSLKFKDADGTWRRKTKNFPGITTKRAAQQALDEWHEAEELSWLESNNPRKRARTTNATVLEYTNSYIEGLEKSHSAAPATIDNYRCVAKYLARYPIGKLPLQELEPEDVEEWLALLFEDELSPSTVRKAYNVLHVAVKHALQTHRLKYDPMLAVRKPKIPRREPNSIARENLSTLSNYLDLMPPTAVNIGIALAFYTGMREGEVCGLRWVDVDLMSPSVKICQVVARTRGKIYIKEPKTETSRRTIPIAPRLAEKLAERKKEAKRECERAGVPFHPTMYVIGSVGDGSGKFMNPNMLWKAWKAIANSLGLVGTQGKVPTFHDLRHTYATMAIANGADVKSVQTLLGHSSAMTTLNIYATQDNAAVRLAVENTANAISQTAPDPRLAQLAAMSA